MKFMPVYIWKQAPFIRFIIPFIAGIITEWKFPLPLTIILIGLTISLFLLSWFNLYHITVRYKFYYVPGWGIHGLFYFLGCASVYAKDVRQDKDWIQHQLHHATSIIVTIQEPLSEKPKSYKAFAKVENVYINDTIKQAKGNLILYLKKDSTALSIKYGSRLLITSRLQPIKNFTNTTGFDYKNYCALQNIYHQVYLTSNQYIILPTNNSAPFMNFLFELRTTIINILRTYIKGSKEAGLAEALLIGYKEDLDKSLLQSYSNTGVVHVIAISGLHVGLIYSILLLIISPMTNSKYARWMRPLILLIGLWSFSLLAGGSPSVLRSAVMFSGIVLGNSLSKKSSVYNSLAASAFLLLCYHPLWLWDVGFQLSYIAVLSLAIFANPINNSLYIKNKLLDLLWKMVSITLAAQILTTPPCLYYFHQFPNIFLITNMIAIPLSSLILLGEILLCCLHPFPALAAILGIILEWLIKIMNDFILYMEKMPFALTSGVGISIHQVIILYVIIIIIGRICLRNRQFAE